MHQILKDGWIFRVTPLNPENQLLTPVLTRLCC
jgi:hypothetical protein